MIDEGKLAILGGSAAIPASVPFHDWPQIDRDDEQMVLASLRQPNHAFGPNCTALQDEFAKWNGNAYCAATNSGTAALHMCIAAAGVRSGDEVITTTLSWTSSATCILHHNAIPVFVDVEWRTMLIDPSRIEAAITPRTRAILVVHYWGVPCDMDAIHHVANKHGLVVIEDAAQAHGALYKGKRAGTLAACAAFSLNQNKNLCGGEGGLFVTDDRIRFETGRALMNFGERAAPEGMRDYHASAMGWMYRTSDLAAAFARSQLRKLDASNERTLANWKLFHQLMEGVPSLVRPFTSDEQQTNGYAYVVRIDPEAAKRRGVPLARLRDAVAAALRAEGVPLLPPRWLLPAHGVFQSLEGYGHGCPWTCCGKESKVSYDLALFQEGVRCADASLWIGAGKHFPLRPPNGAAEVTAVAEAVAKVFRQIDAVPL